MCIFLDLFSRRVLGCATSNRINSQLALSALEAAIGRRKPDQVSQFFQKSQYSSGVYTFWNSLTPELRIAAAVFIGQSYDHSDIDLVVNEFHAFTLDRVFSGVPDEYISQLSNTAPEQANALMLLRTNSENLRTALINSIRSAGVEVLYEILSSR